MTADQALTALADVSLYRELKMRELEAVHAARCAR